MDDRGEVHFLLGMLINRDHKAKTITISQRNYMEKISKRFGMKSCKLMSTPMKNGKKFNEVQENKKAKPSNDHWIEVKRVLCYLKVTLNYGLKDTAEISWFLDSDRARGIDLRRSTSDYVFKLGGNTVS
ncbi:uncharacterized protein LOC124440933 [Xenia sp. Carnegie-2017]|uniref:uncharacterized protein LOC124440933 n=1 Tax=Xenia sp. Carnegie-2017 TaxID=2897299 RepID=UPI001F043A50|nr:uncharacterized protein LOC124440933 [Xenia sp. Carnegie-2017]